MARERWIWLAACVAIAALVGTASLMWRRPAAADAARANPARVILPLPEGVSLAGQFLAPLRLAISPTGDRIVFSATGQSRVSKLWIANLADGSMRELDGTDDGQQPTFTPDGRRLTFTAYPTSKVLELESGTVKDLTSATYAMVWRDGLLAATGGPGNWSIITMPNATAAPTTLVPAAGGGSFVGFPQIDATGRPRKCS